MIVHSAEVRWRREAADDFLAFRYSRAHAWHFDGGAVVAASSSPHAVPLPFSVAAHVDPEEALVAAAASCHMLSFLYEAARARLEVVAYEDASVGHQQAGADGHASIVEVQLRPHVTFGGARLPTADVVDDLHARAHARCLIARSLRAPVTCAHTWRHDARSLVRQEAACTT